MSNIRYAAALAALALPMAALDAEVLARPAYSIAPPNVSPWAPRSGRIRTPGKHRPSGAKLWRKAREGKLGVRW